MPEPKISRRCPTCQASIRGEAFFCPQCGNKIDRSPSKPAPSIHDTEEAIIDASQTLTESDFRSRNKEKGPSQPGKSATRQRALGEVGSKIQRVTNKARVVEGDVIQRVQKFREISNVVIDEASYDPSLRFVLVAAVLFVLFLVIVLLNKFIG